MVTGAGQSSVDVVGIVHHVFVLGRPTNVMAASPDVGGEVAPGGQEEESGRRVRAGRP